MTTPNVLSTQESNRLLDLEAVIEKNKQAFLEVGAALLEIQEKRLYREGYNTFEVYISEKHGIGRSTAYQYIKAAGVRQELAQNGVTELPSNEAQYRELANVSSAHRVEVWQEAAEIAQATGQKVTAKSVSAIADKRKPKVEVQEVTAEEVPQQITLYIDVPMQVAPAPQPVREAGFGLGGIHKKSATPTPQVQPEPSALEEEIAELKQRPTQLEYQIALGKIEELEQQLQQKQANSYEGKEVTSDLLRQILLEKYVDGHVFINYHVLTTDLMQHCKELKTKAVLHKLLTNFAKSLAASDLFVADGDKLTLRREKPAPSEDFSNYFMFKLPSNESLQSIIQQYFPVQVDTTEDEYMFDVITYRKANENLYLTFSEKRNPSHFYFNVYVSNQKPNDLSGDYLNCSVLLCAKYETELHAILTAIR